jgi:hypothetical protein
MGRGSRDRGAIVSGEDRLGAPTVYTGECRADEIACVGAWMALAGDVEE